MKPTNPLTYVESLLKARIETQLASSSFASVPVHTGESDGKRTVPCVVAFAATATTPADIPDFLRNYEVQTVLTVESKADIQPDGSQVAGLGKHRDLVREVMDAVRDVSGLKAAAAAAGHKIYDIQPVVQQPELVEETRSFQTNVTITIAMVFDLPPA